MSDTNDTFSILGIDLNKEYLYSYEQTSLLLGNIDIEKTHGFNNQSLQYIKENFSDPVTITSELKKERETNWLLKDIENTKELIGSVYLDIERIKDPTNYGCTTIGELNTSIKSYEETRLFAQNYPYENILLPNTAFSSLGEYASFDLSDLKKENTNITTLLENTETYNEKENTKALKVLEEACNNSRTSTVTFHIKGWQITKAEMKWDMNSKHLAYFDKYGKEKQHFGEINVQYRHWKAVKWEKIEHIRFDKKRYLSIE